MMNTVKNVVFLITHDIGLEIGPYGRPMPTPNLNRFSEEGLRFDKAFTNSPCCSPARCCLMTGKYAHTTGGIGLSHKGWPLPAAERTIVDILNDHGIETAHFGHNHERHAGENRYQIDEERSNDDKEAAVSIPKAIPYLEDRSKSGTPFYLNIGIASTHRGHYSRYVEMYGGAIPLAEAHVPLFLPHDENTRKEFAAFAGAVRHMDEQVGLLFDTMERLGLFENTLVIFTTDHGIAAERSKDTLYDRGVETALLMRTPGVQGKVFPELVQNIDLAPTVLQALGVPIPDDMQGRSLWPLIQGEDYQPHRQIFTERNFHGQNFRGAERNIDHFDPIRAVRTEHYHYIRWFQPEARGRSWLPWELEGRTGSPSTDYSVLWPDRAKPRPAEELYDVSQDPMEWVNLADRPEYAELKRDLAASLQSWMEETDDFLLSGKIPERYEEPTWGHNWPRSDTRGRFVRSASPK